MLLEFKEKKQGLYPVLTLDLKNQNKTFVIKLPINIKLFEYGSYQPSGRISQKGYDYISNEDGKIICRGRVKALEGSIFEIVDVWLVDNGEIKLDREVKVVKQGVSKGFSIELKMDFNFKTTPQKFYYFLPSYFYKRNDLDHDGIPDRLRTYKQYVSEDKLPIPTVLVFDPNERYYIALIRMDNPKYTQKLTRDVGDTEFIHETHIGSLGFSRKVVTDEEQTQLVAYYPYYEGEFSFMLNRFTAPFDSARAYLPNIEGSISKQSYVFMGSNKEEFTDAVWEVSNYFIKNKNPQAKKLPVSLEETIKIRSEFLNKYFLCNESDPLKPAGYTINFHPTEGKVLSNMIEYGFTGRNTENAYAMLRYGNEIGNVEYIKNARKVINFAVSHAQLDNGFLNTMYNVDKKEWAYWWVGLLLPLLYANTKKEKGLSIGPFPGRLTKVINKLKKIKGCYFRCMCEGARGILWSYNIEKKWGTNHNTWLMAAEKYGDFILKCQGKNGEWGRAYDMQGVEVTAPSNWFGASKNQRKSSTPVAIPFLIELYKTTCKEKYLKSALRAADYTMKQYVNPIEYCGGIFDNGLGAIEYDDEGITYALEGLLDIYEITKDEKYLNAAIIAGRLHSTWIYMWDVPLPENSTLAKQSFYSTGWGAALTSGAGYVHPYPLFVVRELIQLSEYTSDMNYFKIAELVLKSEQQTLAVEGSMFGYAEIGIQEEGYCIGNFNIDDTEFQKSNFGQRWKGEGNKTCLGWEYAVALCGMYKVIDRYGTLNLDEIKDNLEIMKKR